MDTQPVPTADDLLAFWFEAARRGDAEALAALVRAGADVEATDPRGFSALVLASYHGHVAATRLLLAAGARPDGMGDGDSALMGVAFKGHVALAELLLLAGADPLRANAGGRTALMLAAEHGHQAIAELLASHHANGGDTDAAGDTAAALARAQGSADQQV